MAGNVEARKSRLSPDDGDESDISLTSTIEDNDPNKEWEVDDVVAVDNEYPKEKGGLEIRYLVLWAGYDLGDGTWEPEENLSPALMQQWEERKAREERGEEREFDKQAWYDARAALERAKRNRHRRRNAKRRRLGEPPTEPIEEEEEEEEEDFDPILDPETVSDSSNEAAEDNTIINNVEDSPPSSKPRGVITPVRRPGMFKGLPPKTSTTAIQGRERDEARRASTTAAAPGPPVARPFSESKPTSRSYQEAASATGYRGTARKPSSTTTVRLPASVSQPRSSFAAKFGGKKPLTAKRSAKPAAFTGNVFSGGKIRKKKQNLGEAMVDSTKDPKHFTMRRIIRKAELHSRNKADGAPDISLVQASLFNPSEGPPPRKRSRDLLDQGVVSEDGTLSLHRRVSAIAQVNFGTTMEPRAPETRAGSTATNSSENSTKGAKKAVRFLDDDGSAVVGEPMQIDTEIVAPVHEKLSSGDVGIPSVERLGVLQSTAPHHNSSSSEMGNRPDGLSLLRPQVAAVQSIGKSLVLGPRRTRIVEVTFNGLPKETPSPWLANFTRKEKLEIGHQCFARSFIGQIDHLRAQALCNGIITSDDPLVGGLADHLRISLSGLYYSQPAFNLIIYPTKCDEWKSDTLGAEPTSPEGVVLKYSFFTSPYDLGPILRQQLERQVPVQGDLNVEHPVRNQLFRDCFDIDYQVLVSSATKHGTHEKTTTSPNRRHIFYLAFPHNKQEICRSVCVWLRDSNPECRIYTTYQKGAWLAFLEASRADRGIIMIHEALVWTVRHFPGLSKVLQNPKLNMWCFSESIQAYPLYTSQTSVPTVPGTISLTRMFPKGSAILITPSFMVSEPDRTQDIFHWYFQKKSGDTSYKLVTAWNIQGFLQDLALEKSQQRANFTVGERRLEERLAGITETDCKVRFKTAAMVSNYIALREEQAGPYSTLGEDGLIIYADECINANDEQSLVNWFGWWSTLRSHQYRQFVVVGSNDDILKPPSKRGVRHIRIPRYSQSSNNNPDSMAEKDECPSTETLSQNSIGPQSRSIFLQDNDNAALFVRRLRELERKPSALRLYTIPVSWADLPMADHFGDPKGEFARISDWFNWPPSWNRGKFGDPSNFRTYIGFFYTIPGEWDPASYPPQQKPRRHPWIAIYRPVNVHLTKFPYTKSEVIIWDVWAGEKYGDHDQIRECDLPYMQRQVIQYIREHGPEKNPDAPLQRAFLGGFQLPKSVSDFPIDITFSFLQGLLADIVHRLPGHDVHLPALGYKKIVLGGSSPGDITSGLTVQATAMQQDILQGETAPMDLDEPEDCPDDQSRAIIFHPPRGTHRLFSGKNGLSKCQNALFESTRLARIRNKNATTMKYTYKPTMQWYEEQKAEGRGYEHIHVSDSDTVFKVLGIN